MRSGLLILAFLCISTFVVASQISFASKYAQVSLSTNRVVVFGALLPLHEITEQEKQRVCGPTRNQHGMIWRHALDYAIEEVNRYWRWPINISMSLQVRDTCSDEQTALEKALEFAGRYQKKEFPRINRAKTADRRTDFRAVLAVISAEENKDASTLLGLFKVPELIFGKTAPGKYRENTLHSISVGFYKARALVDIIHYFTWSAVSVVYSDTHRNEFDIFLQISRAKGICIAVIAHLTFENNSTQFKRVLDELSTEPQTTVVIMFTEEKETAVVQGMAKTRSVSPHFTWIITNQQSFSCFNEMKLEDTLFLIPQYPFMEGFKKFYFRVAGDSFSDFFRQPSKVSIKKSCEEYSSTCILGRSNISLYEKNSCLNTGAKFDWLQRQTNQNIQSAMNSVFLLAHSYKKALETGTPDVDRAVLSEGLRRVLRVLYGNNWKRYSGQRQMKENMFSLLYMSSNGSRNKLLNIGTWDRSWYISHQRLKWRAGSTPKSSCGVECPSGHIRVVKEGCKCCWTCYSCHNKQIVQDEFTCADCMRGYWPSEDFKRCEFQWTRTLFDCALAVLAVVMVFSFMVL